MSSKNNSYLTQYEKMMQVVQLAGGVSLYLEKRPTSFSALVQPSAIVMYCEPGSAPKWYKDCTAYMTRYSSTTRHYPISLGAQCAKL